LHPKLTVCKWTLIDGKLQIESFCLFSAICYNGFALWEEFQKMKRQASGF
jgi:hypothetical protein